MENVPGSLGRLRHHPYIWVGTLLVIAALTAALAAPLLTGYDPLEVRARDRLLAPSAIHLMGTDEFGRDVFSRILYGARASMQIGLLVVVLTTLAGAAIGLVIGYYPRVDRFMSRVIDGLMAFPEIIIAITLAAIWGAGKTNIILALSFAYFPRMARVVRGSVLSVRNLEYVDAGRAAGAGDGYLLLRHILPNCVSPIIVQATFCFAAAILAEAALSFLGVGIKEPEPSWGGMVSQGRNYMAVAPWVILYPGGAIMLTVLGLNLLGDGLRDLLDPRLK